MRHDGMNLGLEGKVALVTGGGRNIGRAVCLTLAQHGCDVVVNVRSNLDEAQAVVDEIAALGRRAISVAANVGDRAAVMGMVAHAEAELGSVDVLVNCAAIRPHARFLDLTEQEWQELLAINLSGPLYAATAVLPGMIAKGSGSIINFSGIGTFTGSWPHLGAAKAGVHGLTRGLAREFGPRGIRVNIVVPSTIETSRAEAQHPERVAAEIARTPLRRLGTAEEIANLVAFLASDRSSYITGQSIHANGGQYMP